MSRTLLYPVAFIVQCVVGGKLILSQIVCVCVCFSHPETTMGRAVNFDLMSLQYSFCYIWIMSKMKVE